MAATGMQSSSRTARHRYLENSYFEAEVSETWFTFRVTSWFVHSGQSCILLVLVTFAFFHREEGSLCQLIMVTWAVSKDNCLLCRRCSFTLSSHLPICVFHIPVAHCHKSGLWAPWSRSCLINSSHNSYLDSYHPWLGPLGLYFNTNK